MITQKQIEAIAWHKRERTAQEIINEVSKNQEVEYVDLRYS